MNSLLKKLIIKYSKRPDLYKSFVPKKENSKPSFWEQFFEIMY